MALKLSKCEKKLILHLYSIGLSITAVGKRIERSETAVRSTLIENRVWIRPFMYSVPRGENHYGSKLTIRMVKKIRSLYITGVTMKELADQYAVTPTCIRLAIIGNTWKHVSRR